MRRMTSTRADRLGPPRSAQSPGVRLSTCLLVGLLVIAGCGSSSRPQPARRSTGGPSSGSTSPPTGAAAAAPESTAEPCSDPAGICAAVHSPGIAPRPVSATAGSTVQAALALDRRNDLAASLYNLLHGHHQHVSAPACQQTAVFTCTVWVTPIQEQLTVAIACKQHGTRTVGCTTVPQDFTPSHAMSLSYPGTQAFIQSHGYTLTAERCDDPWGPPRQILDPAGLTRTYHCNLLLAKAGRPAFTGHALLWLGLAQGGGGWHIQVLNAPGLHAAGTANASAT